MVRALVLAVTADFGGGTLSFKAFNALTSMAAAWAARSVTFSAVPSPRCVMSSTQLLVVMPSGKKASCALASASKRKALALLLAERWPAKMESPGWMAVATAPFS
eukprot:5851048-Lingulodinium_polyedra.AAC.1